ncbi:MAG TPA: efflux RND transporter periplasmic adaptor subunit [Sulfuriferula sp.]|nr:efflux RND transporter periplasmic adaptor subunit [Sulfuriferula sp.]
MSKTAVVIAVIIAASVAGYWIGQKQAAKPQALETISSVPQTGMPAHKVYVCPMHPQIVQDHPGTCPICGMTLVESETADHAEAALIHVDTATQQKLGITLAAARVKTLAREIHTYATVIADESALHPIAPTVDGVLVKLNVAQTGQQIGRGQVLYEIESPELIRLQHEYVDFLIRRAQTLNAAQQQREQNRRMQQNTHNLDAAGREQMARNIRQSKEQIRAMLQPMERDGVLLTTQLKYAGVTDAMLRIVARTGNAFTVVPVKTQQSCLVKEIGARPGMMVTAMTPIVTCVNDARLWLEVALYPDQTPFVRTGDAVSVRLEDGTQIKTTLANISTIVDPATRTVRARFPVAGHGLRIGEYASVMIQTAPRRALAVPRSAVMHTGHGDFVMRAMQAGHFMPAKVTTGIETEDQVEIRTGLQAGDTVVVNGQFLLDAAASIADAAQRFSGGDQPAHAH